MTKKILNYNYQLIRIAGEFIPEESWDVLDKAKGLYDIIFTHREGIQDDDFSNIKKYCHNKTKIICDITTESGNIQCFLDKFKEITDNQPYEFYLIADTDMKDYFNSVGVKYKTLHSYDLIFYTFLNPVGDNLMSITTDISASSNGFMSLNNSCRIHRILLFSELVKRNISLDNCSFLFTTGGHDGFKFNREVYEGELIKLRDDGIISNELYQKVKGIKVPISIDVDCETNPAYISNKINSIYNPILNLVTENLVGLTDGDISTHHLITFTEKTIKPFQAKQVPLIYGLPNLQKVLRELGFDLFDDLIDTSFEQESNPVTRLEMIVDELERLVKIDLLKYKEDNIDRFIHNYNNLQTLSNRGKSLVESFLYEEILK